MPDLSPKTLKNEARLSLASGNGNHKQIAMLYAAIVLGVSFFSALTYFITDLLILNTAGGLAGLGTTGALKSIASLIETVASVAATFLAMSLTHCAIGFARQDPMETKSLKEGFYRWGVFLRLVLLQGLMYFLFFYLATMLATTLYMLLPGVDATMMQVEPVIMEFQATGVITEAQALGFLPLLWPLVLILLAVSLVFMVPLFYSYRMSFYRIMDNNPPGARRAIAQSRVMMKGRRFKLFRLDLSFWWYYLLQGLANAVLTTATVFLYDLFPGAQLLCSALLCGVMFLIYRKYLAYVETTFAIFYDKVLQLYLPQYPTGEPMQWQPPAELISQQEEENTIDE